MRISHNLEAMNVQRQLGIVRNEKAKVMERLSSGYRINRAADDAAGLAISEKMRSQIRGLNQGSRNVQDGISLCQVADGALSEVHEIIHRINELSVQAANGTNTEEDRLELQYEVNALVNEIDRIGDTTEFNKKKIFKNNNVSGPITGSISSNKGELLIGTVSLGVDAAKLNDLSAQTYKFTSSIQGLLSNNSELIGWSDFTTSDGTILNINNLINGEYYANFHGTVLKLNLSNISNAEKLIDATSDFSFSSYTLISNQKPVSNFQILSDGIWSHDLSQLSRNKWVYRLSATDSGIGAVTWESMGIDPSNISAGTYTYKNRNGIQFSFDVSDGATIDNIKSAINNKTITGTLDDRPSNNYYYSVIHCSNQTDPILDRTCYLDCYSTSEKSQYSMYISPSDYQKLSYIDNTSNMGASFTQVYDAVSDKIYFQYSGNSFWAGSIRSNGVKFVITDESMELLKNYDYTQPSSYANPKLLKFESSGGSYFYAYIKNTTGQGSYEILKKNSSNAANPDALFVNGLLRQYYINNFTTTLKDLDFQTTVVKVDESVLLEKNIH